jgi:hypothetical protein
MAGRPGNRRPFHFAATISRLMRSSSLFRILFILYCIEAGTFLTLAPWFPVWDRALVQAIPGELLRTLILTPFVRAVLTGFGLIHLVWGAHDLDELIFRRHLRAPDV